MNDDTAFERATQELMELGSDRTPDATIAAVILAVRTTPQERDLRIPWRNAPMSNPMRLVAAIAIIAVAGVAAFNLFGSSPGVGGVASPSPTVARPTPAPTPAPSAAPTPFAINTATWTTYTSPRYGFTISRPADWTDRPAIRGWSFPADATADPYSTAVEAFVAADSSIAAAAWSVAVKPGTTVASWLQTYGPAAEGTPFAAIQALTVPASMDGHAGSLVRFGADTQAFFLVNNRIYVVAIWQSEDFIPGGVSRLLEAYLSTMHLLPGGPAPSATPRPS
jgi:hypothetical protein